MKAKEMFKSLEYEKLEDEGGINYSMFIDDTQERKTIYFSKKERYDNVIAIHSFGNVRKHCVVLTFKEIEAIYKQMKELKN